jgi:hypothetical protein
MVHFGGKLFQDSIVVNIPMNVTADLGIAIKRTRDKRIKALYEQFPSLKTEEPQMEKEELDSEDDEEDKEKATGNEAEEKDGDKKKKVKKSAVNPHLPQRNQYGNVLDYLEAKYVRGVMLQDEAELEDQEEEEERGSVYDSDGSFIDDSLLKRDVAEQVLSQATQTKLELEHDDDDFFVNVGTLEVQDHELMDYDPLGDDEKSKKESSAKRKRGTSLDSKTSAAKNTKTTKKGTATTDKWEDKKEQTKKAGDKKSTTSKSPEKAALTNPPERQVEIDALKKRALDLKEESDNAFSKLKDAIKKMTQKNLPRKKKMEKVSIVVPEGKNPGDDITFSNPHVPGQKLRVKVPKNASGGSKFVVSVPVPVKAEPDVDYNKWPRDVQDLMDDFSSQYDDWCHAEAAWREIDLTITKRFQLHHVRMNKFDKLIPLFPKDLLTPVDATYLRKVVRRARQNKHKRTKVQQKQGEDDAEPEDEPSAASSTKTTTKSNPEKPQSILMQLAVPGLGSQFAKVPTPAVLS